MLLDYSRTNAVVIDLGLAVIDARWKLDDVCCCHDSCYSYFKFDLSELALLKVLKRKGPSGSVRVLVHKGFRGIWFSLMQATLPIKSKPLRIHKVQQVALLWQVPGKTRRCKKQIFPLKTV